jgi:hypothetical protein
MRNVSTTPPSHCASKLSAIAMRWVALAGVASTLCSGAARTSEVLVDLELVLVVDSSGSVNGAEFDLQMQGVAAALRDPVVIRAIESYATRGVALALVQWSGRHQQVMAVDWGRITDGPSALAFADRVVDAPRWFARETALADALTFAMGELHGNAFAGARRVIDVSGDGKNNSGGDPDSVRDMAAAQGITINALAILNEQPILDLYYEWHVIGGPGAFVMAARDYHDFARAIRAKLLREIEGTPLSRAPSADVGFPG